MSYTTICDTCGYKNGRHSSDCEDRKDSVPTRFVAIWGYSLYPYHLGGEVTRWEQTGEGLGRVETKEFGKGYWFKPQIVVPYETGKKILDKLKALDVEYKAKKDELHEVYMKKLKEVIKL